MPDDFLEIDEAIQALLEELQNFKSASEHLTLTTVSIDRLLQSTERLTSMSGSVAEQGRVQLETAAQLAGDTTRNLDQFATRQQEQSNAVVQLARDTQHRLDSITATQQEQMSATSQLASDIQQSLDQILKAQQHQDSAVSQLKTDMEQEFSRIVDHQQTLAEGIDTVMKQDILPALDRNRSLSIVNRTLIIIALILSTANLALGTYVFLFVL